MTLDFCGGGYASEALRSRRFQAVYAKQGSDLVLSNEVVRYQAGGAKKALAGGFEARQELPENSGRERLGSRE